MSDFVQWLLKQPFTWTEAKPMPFNEDAETQLAAIRQKIRSNIEPTEAEMAELVLALRAGRRSAAEGQKTKRKAAPPPITVTTLFSR